MPPATRNRTAVAFVVVAAVLCLWMLSPTPPPGTPTTAAPTVDPVVPALGDVPTVEEAIERLDASPPAAVVAPVPEATPPGPRGRLTGRVVDAASTPVSPARVYAIGLRDGKATHHHVLHDDVDAHGRFTIVPTFDGDALVVAIPLQADPSRSDEAARPFVLHPRLLATSAVTEVARDRVVELADLVAPAAVAITGRVNARGHATGGLVAGWRPRDAVHSGLLFEDFSIVRSSTGDGVHVEVSRSNRMNRFPGGAAVAADGTFTIPVQAGVSGSVGLSNTEGAIERLVRSIDVTAPAHVEFDLLAPACVRIVQGGVPVAGLAVTMMVDAGWKEGPLEEAYRTDAAGELRVHRERFGPLRGIVKRPARETLEFTVPDDAVPTSPLLVDLGTVPTVAARVTATAERRVGSFAISMQRLGKRVAFVDMTPVDGAQVPTLGANVPAGAYRLHIAGKGRPDVASDDAFVLSSRVDVTVSDPPQAITVRLEHGGRIRITVITPDGRLVPGTVRVRDARGKETTPLLYAPGIGNGNGIWRPGPLYTAAPLAPGRQEVIVDFGARGVHRQFVDVRACEVAAVTITLQ